MEDVGHVEVEVSRVADGRDERDACMACKTM